MTVPASPTSPAARDEPEARCYACGYPFDGLRAWQLGCPCPECGTVNDPYDPTRAPLGRTRLPGPIAVCFYGFRTGVFVIPFVVVEQWLWAPALVAPVLGCMLILADTIEFTRRALRGRVVRASQTAATVATAIALTLANMLLVAGVSWGLLVMLGVI